MVLPDFIDVKDSKIHGKGVFAATEIPKNKKVIEYFGEKVSKKDAETIVGKQMGGGEIFIFELNNRSDINGDIAGNYAKFINHSCKPNCESRIEDGKIWIVSLRKIKTGEEITYNYGFSIEHYKDHPCNCGSDNCVGYILNESEWGELRKIRNKK
jgi:hypothetical protein